MCSSVCCSFFQWESQSSAMEEVVACHEHNSRAILLHVQKRSHLHAKKCDLKMTGGIQKMNYADRNANGVVSLNNLQHCRYSNMNDITNYPDG